MFEALAVTPRRTVTPAISSMLAVTWAIATRRDLLAKALALRAAVVRCNQSLTRQLERARSKGRVNSLTEHPGRCLYTQRHTRCAPGTTGSTSLATIFGALERIYPNTVKQGPMATSASLRQSEGRVSPPGLGFRQAVGTERVWLGLEPSFHIKKPPKLQTQAPRRTEMQPSTGCLHAPDSARLLYDAFLNRQLPPLFQKAFAMLQKDICKSKKQFFSSPSL